MTSQQSGSVGGLQDQTRGLYDFKFSGEVSRGGRPPAAREHASQKGFDQHRYYGERPCPDCCQAHSDYVKARRWMN